jgi:hypothetical protein
MAAPFSVCDAATWIFCDPGENRTPDDAASKAAALSAELRGRDANYRSSTTVLFHRHGESALCMRMKTCTRCGERKPLDQFPPRRRGEPRLQSWCRGCFAANNARYYREHHDVQKARLLANNERRRQGNRRKAAEYLSTHPCVDCGESDLVVLDFDHVGQKTSAVSALIANGAPWTRIEAEIKECEVRCANCHRMKTSAGWPRHEPRGEVADDRARIVTAPPRQLPLAVALEARTCRVCGVSKALSEFPFRSTVRQTRQWICLVCQRVRTKAWYERNRPRQIAAAHRNNVRRRERAATQVRGVRGQLTCVDCGESNRILLDFDHVAEKIANISAMVRNGLPWSTIAKEIAKCEPRCANCHRRKTAKQQAWWKGLAL